MTTERWERWVRPPQQLRARASFERVLNAAAEVLAERGYDGFAVAEICRRAGVAPGTLYERIEDRAALFLAVHDRELHRITGGQEVALAGLLARKRLSTPRLIGEVVDRLADHYREERGLLKAFILRAAVDPRVRDEGAHFVDRLETASVGVLLSRRADYAAADADRAARVAHRLVVDSLSWRTAFGADFHTSQPLSDAQWTAELRSVVQDRLLKGRRPA